ncbi:hypothetical protein KEM54_003056 [Ascosphaera aggregata]|nr:hypothetical protein KEM54_003056 [Ascosphaera aggregata]
MPCSGQSLPMVAEVGPLKIGGRSNFQAASIAGPLNLRDSAAACMASSKVDRRFLGRFATCLKEEDPTLSSTLYRLLGLSLVFSNKLKRAQSLRHLGTATGPEADKEALDSQQPVLWLAREGLMILEQYVLPRVDPYEELKVLAHKMKASFYHAFVLFHNQPTIVEEPGTSLDNEGIESRVNDILGDLADPENVPVGAGVDAALPTSELFSINPSELNKASTIHLRPQGLYVGRPAKHATSFLLPAVDFSPRTTACFSQAALIADDLLFGSHPLRISVKVEYAAYLYDCLHDSEASGIVAKRAILDTYSATEEMDDESFEDAQELVGILGKISKNKRKAVSLGGGSSSRRVNRVTHRRSKSGHNTNTWTFGNDRRRHTRRSLPPGTVEIHEIFSNESCNRNSTLV